MWGDRFQVLVTTHLNTQTVHNHMIVNVVSYKDGKKFQNHISDHIHLRRCAMISSPSDGSKRSGGVITKC